MSSDILTCLELDKELFSSKVIVAKEINGCDSSFITSCVLGHCVKNKKAVFVILTHNSFMHYQNIGLKMNYNLQKSVDSGFVQFYNAGNEILDKTLANEELLLQDLILKIEKEIRSMQEKHGMVNVILEGVSHLFDLQFTLKDVNTICKVIIDMIREFDNSFFLCHCNVANESDVTHILANLLSHKSNTIVEVESLSSGLSAEVSGHVTIKHPTQKFEHLFTLEQKSYQYLFKLFDRGVKLFAPGTI
ncbi:elongator complex protein 6 [Epargyreus clarus]|uniref:elongator complex protein 6 n=1 Tax=Epargyreus clarus TaxID=520877 RepID=UPI003C3017D8